MCIQINMWISLGSPFTIYRSFKISERQKKRLLVFLTYNLLVSEAQQRVYFPIVIALLLRLSISSYCFLRETCFQNNKKFLLSFNLERKRKVTGKHHSLCNIHLSESGWNSVIIHSNYSFVVYNVSNKSTYI